jgi:hypothetical protein
MVGIVLVPLLALLELNYLVLGLEIVSTDAVQF